MEKTNLRKKKRVLYMVIGGRRGGYIAEGGHGTHLSIYKRFRSTMT